MQKLDKATKRQILFLLTAMFFLGVSATDIYIASLPQMVADFHSTPQMVNLTLSSYSIGIAFGVLFTGELSNRFGRRKVLLYGVGCFSVAAGLITFTPYIWGIIILRIIQSFGCSVILIVPRLILKDSMDEREQVHANGVLLIGLIISPAIAPVLGAYIATYLSWNYCFLFSAIAGLLLVIITLKILPETNLNRTNKIPPLRRYLKGYLSLFKNKVFITLTLIYACGVAAYFAFIGISSYLYIDYLHISPIKYSYIFLGLSAAYLVGNQLMQLLNRKKEPLVNIIGIGVYSTASGVVILIISLFVDNLTIIAVLATIAILLMRVANALITPPIQIKIMSHFHTQSAQALGLNMCIGFSVNSLATYMVTMLPTYPLLSFVLSSGFFIGICLAAYQINRKIVS
ncbi:MAG: Bcr/CflA family efflux MFS transporter [Burkholderiales bacterium]|nr:Bcr/CflA family efflux MFS transporter [Burkholderiales bacterium]